MVNLMRVEFPPIHPSWRPVSVLHAALSSMIYFVFVLQIFACLLQLAFCYEFLEETYPMSVFPGDRVVYYGSPIELFCSLNKTHDLAVNRTSSDLSFTLPNRSIYGESIIVNHTTIRVYKEKPDRGELTVYCKLASANTTALPVFVKVGDNPAPVNNITCKSNNWLNLTCSWKNPCNDINTKYSAVLFQPSRSGRKDFKNCTVMQQPDEVSNCSLAEMTNCTFADKSYDATSQQYHVQITGRNELGKSIQNFTIDHFSLVEPAAPTDLRQVSKTTNSFWISCNIPPSLEHFPPGLNVVIEISNLFNKTWIRLNTSSINPVKSKNFTYEIQNLPYPGTQYDVRVYLQAPGSVYLSQAATQIFTTLSTVPASPPQTTPGTFEVTEKNGTYEIIVYWRELEKYNANAAFSQISYHVDCYSKAGNCSKYCNFDSNSTTNFAKCSMPQDDQYTFHIYSVNVNGTSRNYSQVVVPPYKTVRTPEKPTEYKISEKEYMITWSATQPSSAQYTIFVCEWREGQNSMLSHCDGILYWAHQSGNETSKNVTVHSASKRYTFGVSAQNAENASSGIVWAQCKFNGYWGDIGLILAKPEAAARSAFISWELRCSQESEIKGFIIYYCKSTNPPNPDGKNVSVCIDEEEKKSIEVPNNFATNASLSNLSPYNTYRVDVVPILNSGILGKRETRVLTTAEDAPEPPTDLEVVSFNHTNVTLAWKPPLSPNGVLGNYKLTVYPPTPKMQEIEISPNLHPSVTLLGLQSSTYYEFYLKVCNRQKEKCSNETMTSVTTEVATPEKIGLFYVQIVNQSTANVTWPTPLGLDKPNCNYEVRLRTNMNENGNVHAFNCSENSGLINVGDLCTKMWEKLIFDVHAVNSGPSGVFVGEFSEGIEQRCDSSHLAEIYLLIGLSSFFAILSLVIICISFLVRKRYIRCATFKPKITINMPSELTPPDDQEIWPPLLRTGAAVGATVLKSSSEEKTPLQGKRSDDEEEKQNVDEERAADPHLMPWEDQVANARCASPQSSTSDEDYKLESEDIPAPKGYSHVGHIASKPQQSGYVQIAEFGVIVPARGVGGVVGGESPPTLSCPQVKETTSPSTGSGVVPVPSASNKSNGQLAYIQLSAMDQVAGSTHAQGVQCQPNGYKSESSTEPTSAHGSASGSPYVLHDFIEPKKPSLTKKNKSSFCSKSTILSDAPSPTQNDDSSSDELQLLKSNGVDGVNHVKSNNELCKNDGVGVGSSSSSPVSEGPPKPVSPLPERRCNGYVPHPVFRVN